MVAFMACESSVGKGVLDLPRKNVPEDRSELSADRTCSRLRRASKLVTNDGCKNGERSDCKLNKHPINVAIANDKPIRKKTISGWSRNAVQVAQNTMGLIVGDAIKNPIATEAGAPWVIKRRATGILPHSQTGNKNPIKLPNKEPRSGFWGIQRRSWRSLTKKVKIPEKNTPISKNGIAWTIKLRNRAKVLLRRSIL